MDGALKFLGDRACPQNLAAKSDPLALAAYLRIVGHKMHKIYVHRLLWKATQIDEHKLLIKHFLVLHMHTSLKRKAVHRVANLATSPAKFQRIHPRALSLSYPATSVHHHLSVMSPTAPSSNTCSLSTKSNDLAEFDRFYHEKMNSSVSSLEYHA